MKQLSSISQFCGPGQIINRQYRPEAWNDTAWLPKVIPIGLLAVSLLLSSIGIANADTTVTSADKMVKVYVHSTGIVSGITAQGELRTEAYTSIVKGASVERVRIAVTGCDTEVGGFIGDIDENTNLPTGKQFRWFYPAVSLHDGIAASVCKEAYVNKNAKRVSYK